MMVRLIMMKRRMMGRRRKEEIHNEVLGAIGRVSVFRCLAS